LSRRRSALWCCEPRKLPYLYIQGKRKQVERSIFYGNALQETQRRNVRISKGERYKNDFTPPPELKPDDTTVLLYDAKKVDRDRVIDLSGHGNDGIWKTP
jgi:hypothetical protein